MTCGNVLSLIDRKCRVRQQDNFFFAIIQSLRSAKLLKYSIVAWHKRSCKTTRVQISRNNPKSMECENFIVDKNAARG